MHLGNEPVYIAYQNLSKKYKAPLSNLHTMFIPKNLSEAFADQKWEDAMKVEMEALVKNKTWEMVKLPNRVKHVGCRWVFYVKHKLDGSIDKYKPMLVAKGCSDLQYRLS